MPTTKPRYMLTDTGELSDLLDAAERRWPEVTDRKALLLRLAAAGAGAIATEAEKRREEIDADRWCAYGRVRAGRARAAARGLARVIVLDASVLIAHLDGRDPHHEPAVELLRAHAMELLGASQISLAETLVAPARAGRLEDAQEALEKLSVRELAFGHDASPRLASLRAETGLKLPGLLCVADGR